MEYVGESTYLISSAGVSMIKIIAFHLISPFIKVLFPLYHLPTFSSPPLALCGIVPYGAIILF